MHPLFVVPHLRHRAFSLKTTGALLVLAAAFLGRGAAAPLALGRAFSDHMVLQRNAPVKIWGTAAPGATLTVRFGVQKVRVTADAKGDWMATLSPMPPDSTPQVLGVTDGAETRFVRDVLVGEVWICSGQSNMRFTLRQSVGGGGEAAAACDPLLRLLNLEGGAPTATSAYSPREFDVLQADRFFQGSWGLCTSNTASGFSAVGYWFGKKIRRWENVPVGLICNAVGGSPMAAWLPAETLRSRPEYMGLAGSAWLDSPRIQPWVQGRARKNLGDRPAANHPFKPAFLFESGVRWLAPMTVAGCLWYQGESDAQVLETDFNEMMLTDLIAGWRDVFGQRSMPFVMVQLPRIHDSAEVRQGWPQFREVQAQVAAKMTNVLNCVTIDLGSTDANVHPPDKQPVAERLVNLVRRRIYRESVPAESPTLEGWTNSGATMTVRFRHGDGLATTDGAAPRGFEVAGSDGAFYPANASVRGDGAVVLKSPRVLIPVAARYDWAVFVTPNLTNAAGLPVAPFRTGNGKVGVEKNSPGPSS